MAISLSQLFAITPLYQKATSPLHHHHHTTRRGVLFAYERDSYFGSSSALALYELAWKMSRDSNDLLWSAWFTICAIPYTRSCTIPAIPCTIF